MSKQSPGASPARFIGSLAFMSAVAVSLLLLRLLASDSHRYSFLIWNLFLAAVPVGLAWWLIMRVRRYGWRQWQQVVLAMAWIIFLPNSFYLITDLIHLRPNYEADLLFDIILLTAFVLSGLALGFLSVYWVHREILKRLSERWTYGLVALLFVAVSFAVCLGRYTRWNTWDIILRPAGLLFDVSDRVLNPGLHMETYQTTLTLFLLLASTYAVIYEAARLIRLK